jgi:hypothetical protein
VFYYFNKCAAKLLTKDVALRIVRRASDCRLRALVTSDACRISF